MENRLDISLKEIVAATQGRLLNAEGPLTTDHSTHPFSEMVYDSRKAIQDCIFVCIKGEKADGHNFIADVSKLGTKLVIGDNAQKLREATKFSNPPLLLHVDNVLEALQQLATFYRRKFSIPTIGLSGSSGKTTTKDLLGSILKAAGSALVTEGTLNNHWGVPQTVLKLRRHHKVAVFEMGISDFGELEALTSICQPEIGYLTTIGSAHLEKLRDLDGVLKAKRELFDWITEHAPNRALVFNVDNPQLNHLYDEYKKRGDVKLYSISQKRKDTDVYLVSAKPLGIESRFGSEYTFASPWGEITGTLPLPGQHNIANALAAATLAMASGTATLEHVVQGLAHPAISKLRSELFKMRNGAAVYNDSYNANPTSVAAAFEAVKEIAANPHAGFKHTVAVVGDMLELGPNSAELHRKMGRLAAEQGISTLLATGKSADEWVRGFQSAKNGTARAFASHDALLTGLEQVLPENASTTLILVKGSRGAKMDLVVEKLKK